MSLSKSTPYARDNHHDKTTPVTRERKEKEGGRGKSLGGGRGSGRGGDDRITAAVDLGRRRWSRM
jgi:hypothetical protein